MHTDEHLNVWGERFVQSALRDCMRFEQFMEMNPALRERKLYMAEASAQQALERKLLADVPDAVMRGDQLIEPLHHTVGNPSDRGAAHHLRRALK